MYSIVLQTAFRGYVNERIMTKISFASPEGPKARAFKTGINFIIFIFIFVENCLQYEAIYNFLVWLRTSSNPADINRFGSHIGKYIIYGVCILFLYV